MREFENIFKFLQSSAHFGASDLRAESHDEKNGLVSTGDVFEETEVEVIEVEYEKTPNQVHLDPNVARTRIDEVIKRERPTRFDVYVDSEKVKDLLTLPVGQMRATIWHFDDSEFAHRAIQWETMWH